jgi:mannose-6-phosphate isomerase-like protein (cupin superfamily)
LIHFYKRRKMKFLNQETELLAQETIQNETGKTGYRDMVEDSFHTKDTQEWYDTEEKVPEGNEDPEHHSPCNEEFHHTKDVEMSRQEYNWKVVDPFAGKWESWEAIGESVPHPKYEIKWTNCADMSHAWTGIMILTPGQIEPLHQHSAPMIYYILKGQPIVTLNGIKNRTSTWHCVSIPSFCPHGVYNDSQSEEVAIAWCYLTTDEKAKPKPNKEFQWKFLQELDSL